MLFHIAYASTAATRFDHEALLDILRRAREKNHRLGVTGVLLHHEGHFFQVIEGPVEAVQSLYETIARDPRHGQLVKIVEEPIFKRDFAEWTMGLAELDTQALQSIEGLNSYFQHEACFNGLCAGRALKLMRAFKQGRWRQRLESQVA